MENKNNKITGDCMAKNNVLTCGSVPLTLDVKGSLPSSGTITFDSKGNVEEVTDLTINGYKFSYSSGKWTGVKDSSGTVTPPTPETERLATIDDVGDYVNYIPDNATWDASRDGVSESKTEVQGTFNIYNLKKEGNKSVNGESKNNSITCQYYVDDGFFGELYYDNKYNGWRVMNVSSTGQITLIHAGTPECYYHNSGQEAVSATLLNTNSTSSNVGESKAWTKYGNSTYALNVHYMDGQDWEIITKNMGTQKTLSQCEEDGNTPECGIGYELIDTGSDYWLANSREEVRTLYYWQAHNQYLHEVSDFSDSYGVRPVIVLKSNVKIKQDAMDGSSSKPYNLTT